MLVHKKRAGAIAAEGTEKLQCRNIVPNHTAVLAALDELLSLLRRALQRPLPVCRCSDATSNAVLMKVSSIE